MDNSVNLHRPPGVRAFGARLATALACLLAALCVAGRARAGCIDAPTPEGRRLQMLAEADAREALRQSGAYIATQLAQPHPDARELAMLYGVQAYAYEELELDADARASAATGLKWVTAPNDPVGLNLQMIAAENTYDQAGLEGALVSIEAAHQRVEPGSVAEGCLLITLGRLQYRSDRIDLAVRSLTRAYADSAKASRPRQRVLAAGALAAVLREAGDYPQAQALFEEERDWDIAHGLTLDLSVARYQLGSVFQQMGRHDVALREFEQGRALSLQLGDGLGVAFDDLHICQSKIELGGPAGTRRYCERALQAFDAAKSTDMIKETRATLAQLDLAEGHPAAALLALNEVLEKSGSDMLPRRVARIYQLRAQAEAQLGQYRAAYADAGEFVRRYQQANEAERVRQVTALRTRFESDREIQRNDALQHELELARERARQQRQQLHWIGALAVAGAALIALLGYTVYSSLRHRRALERMASEDSLTGLPNRRHATQLAEQLIAGAARRGEVLTVALVDLDHFKRINDRCGHAAGDRVLQEFARVARREVRTGDVLARWGGEEFLLVMADCTLDYGLATLERLRAAVARIALDERAGDGGLTVSAGLTTNEHGVNSLEELVAHADTALYEAKHGGRDRVRISEEAKRSASTGVRRAMAG